MFERLKRQKLLKSIKERLSGEFKIVSLKYPEAYPEVYSIICEYGKENTLIESRIDENDRLHVVVTFDSCILYHLITKNYEWFHESVIF